MYRFLDFTGAWDPSLAFVMGGGASRRRLCSLSKTDEFATGLAVSALGVYRRNRKQAAAAAAGAATKPGGPPLQVDKRLVAGAVLFGVGWAIAGICPGPALASAALPAFGVPVRNSLLPFIASMYIGTRLVEGMDDLKTC